MDCLNQKQINCW